MNVITLFLYSKMPALKYNSNNIAFTKVKRRVLSEMHQNIVKG